MHRIVLYTIKLVNQIKSLFIAGILTLLPLGVSLAALTFIYRIAHRYLAPVGAFDLVLIVAGIIVIGAIGKLVINKTIISPVETIMHRIPIAGALYSGVKSLVDFLNTSKHPDFKRQVVLIPFPYPGSYAIALMFGPADDDYAPLIPNLEHRLVKVWVPTNHFSPLGHFLLVPASSVIPTQITFEEATKALVSCGIIVPSALVKKKNPEA